MMSFFFLIQQLYYKDMFRFAFWPACEPGCGGTQTTSSLDALVSFGFFMLATTIVLGLYIVLHRKKIDRYVSESEVEAMRLRMRPGNFHAYTAAILLGMLLLRILAPLLLPVLLYFLYRIQKD